MKKVKIYRVLDKEGKLVFKGSANEIGKRFGRDPESVRFCFKRQQRFCWKYRIEDGGMEEREEMYENEYIDIRWHIKNYGNTISLIEPSIFIKRLAEEGIKVSSKKIGKEWLLERC